MKPHKHADLIKAWADGVEIECWDGKKWFEVNHPIWIEHNQFRIKPEIKPNNGKLNDS
jgi:phage major head subunit gpT-like protein